MLKPRAINPSTISMGSVRKTLIRCRFRSAGGCPNGLVCPSRSEFFISVIFDPPLPVYHRGELTKRVGASAGPGDASGWY